MPPVPTLGGRWQAEGEHAEDPHDRTDQEIAERISPTVLAPHCAANEAAEQVCGHGRPQAQADQVAARSPLHVFHEGHTPSSLPSGTP